MSRIRDVISFEVHRTIKKKSFWYTSLSIPVIVIAVMGVSIISSNNAQKTNQQQAQDISKNARIAVLDDTGLIDTQGLAKQHIELEASESSGIAAVKSGKVDAFFYYPKNVLSSGIYIYAQDQGISLTSPYNAEATDLLKQSILVRVSSATHSSQIVKLLGSSPNVNITTYKNGKQTNSLATIIAPGVFMVAFLTLMVLMSYLMITAATEEKENRVAEILLTSIRSRTLILGKIFAIFILGAAQILVIVVPVVIALILLRTHISLPGGVSLSHIPINFEAVTFGALFLIAGLVLFTGLLVGLSALFPSAQEAGRYVGVAIIWAYIPIYSLSYIVTSPHTLIVSVFTYFPLTAPTTSLLRNAVGTISTEGAIVSLLISCLCASAAIMFAIRAFRYGAMEYGRRISIKELF